LLVIRDAEGVLIFPRMIWSPTDILE
jgi:hypothetical protein